MSSLTMLMKLLESHCFFFQFLYIYSYLYFFCFIKIMKFKELLLSVHSLVVGMTHLCVSNLYLFASEDSIDYCIYSDNKNC